MGKIGVFRGDPFLNFAYWWHPRRGDNSRLFRTHQSNKNIIHLITITCRKRFDMMRPDTYYSALIKKNFRPKINRVLTKFQKGS
jgi:hypothetical protein